MDEVLRYWPIIVAFALIVAWLVRIEVKGVTHDDELKKCATTDQLIAAETAVETQGHACDVAMGNLTRATETAVDNLAQSTRDVYATKVELATLTGSMNGLSIQVADVRKSQERIEGKLDAVLTAKHAGNRTGGV